MALTVTTRPSKNILDSSGSTYLTSRWNSAHLPIIYKLNSNLFPTNSSDGTDCFTSVYGTNGYATFELCINYEPYQELEYVQITNSSVESYNGIWQIRDFIDGNTLVLDLAYDTTATGNIQKYYNNYHVLVKVYAGLPATHPLNASKPMELIGTIKQIPDSDNNIIIDVHRLIKDKLSLKDEYHYTGTIDVDLNAFTGFYIEYAEGYDTVSGGEVTAHVTSYTSDSSNVYWAVNAIMPLQSTYGGNVGEYVFTYNSAQIAGKFLTNGTELIQKNGEYFDVSAIIPKDVFDDSDNGFVQFVINRYGVNGDFVEPEQRITITNRHDGVYRLRDVVNREYGSNVDHLGIRLIAFPTGGNLFTDADDGTFESAFANTTEGTNVHLERVDSSETPSVKGGSFNFVTVSEIRGSFSGKVLYISAELVSDGDFGSGASWTTGTSWSIGAGVATHTGGSFGNLTQNIGIVSGSKYRVVFTVNSITTIGGESYVAIGIDDAANKVTITGTGSYSQDITVSGTSFGNVIVGSNDDLVIDNISVKELVRASDSLVFSGDSAISVQANREYFATAYVSILLPNYLNETGFFENTEFVYLKPTTYSLAECREVWGLQTAQTSLVYQALIVYDNGNYRTRYGFGNGTNRWIDIKTIFNTGANTSINLGLYLNGTLSRYAKGATFYIDRIELRGPIEYLSAEYTINIDQDCSNQEITLKWLNNLGGWDQYTFTGKKDYTVDIEDDVRYIKDVTQDWDSDFINGTEEEEIHSRTHRDFVTVRSQYVDKDYLDNVLKGILKSPKVYRVGDTKLLTVLIERGSYKIYTDMDRVYSIQFDFKYSNIGRSQEQ